MGYSVWVFGTFLITLIVLLEFLIGPKLPGGMFYIVITTGPILGICGAAATNHGALGKIYLILTTLCLQPIQFIIITMVSLAIIRLSETQ